MQMFIETGEDWKDTIRAVNEKVREVEELPPDRQHVLSHRGRQLEDHVTLAELDLRGESSLRVSVANNPVRQQQCILD